MNNSNQILHFISCQLAVTGDVGGCASTHSQLRMGVGHLLLPAQLPETHWAMICVIRRLALTVSDVCLKLGCFQSTSTYSALDVSLYKFRTYVLWQGAEGG